MKTGKDDVSGSDQFVNESRKILYHVVESESSTSQTPGVSKYPYDPNDKDWFPRTYSKTMPKPVGAEHQESVDSLRCLQDRSGYPPLVVDKYPRPLSLQGYEPKE